MYLKTRIFLCTVDPWIVFLVILVVLLTVVVVVQGAALIYVVIQKRKQGIRNVVVIACILVNLILKPHRISCLFGQTLPQEAWIGQWTKLKGIFLMNGG